MRHRLFGIVVIFLSTLNLPPLFGQDSTVVFDDESQAHGTSSVYGLSETELILMLDSLFESASKESRAFAAVRTRLDDLNAMNLKNQFQSGFAFWPAHRFYGVWNTTILFPYRDSQYKSEQIMELDLSPEISGNFTYPFSGVVASKYGYRDSAFHRGIDIDPYCIIDWDTRKLNANKIELVRTRYGYAVHPVGLFTHLVKKGDNLSKVSQRYAVSIKQLKAWNGYVRLTPGMMVCIAPPEEQNGTF